MLPMCVELLHQDHGKAFSTTFKQGNWYSQWRILTWFRHDLFHDRCMDYRIRPQIGNAHKSIETYQLIAVLHVFRYEPQRCRDSRTRFVSVCRTSVGSMASSRPTSTPGLPPVPGTRTP